MRQQKNSGKKVHPPNPYRHKLIARSPALATKNDYFIARRHRRLTQRHTPLSLVCNHPDCKHVQSKCKVCNVCVRNNPQRGSPCACKGFTKEFCFSASAAEAHRSKLTAHRSLLKASSSATILSPSTESQLTKKSLALQSNYNLCIHYETI